MKVRNILAWAAIGTALAAGCGTGQRPSFVDDNAVSSSSTSSSTTTSIAPAAIPPKGNSLAGGEPVSVAAPNGRTYPVVASSPAGLAQELVEVEQALADPVSDPASLPDLGHRQQVLYRVLARDPSITSDMFKDGGTDLEANISDHLAARRAFIELSSDYPSPTKVAAWNIVEPEPLDQLISYYQEAEAATGIEWEFLAAINLVETGMGRIRGVSTAGAQGPMQFLPTTWAEPGIGDGDINDPHDAIQASARYLVRRGGPANMPKALFGYNNADEYVSAVSHYAALFQRNQANLTGPYHWEIHYSADIGDLWLPVGYSQLESLDAEIFVTGAPWSVPPWGLTDRPPPTTMPPEIVPAEETES